VNETPRKASSASDPLEKKSKKRKTKGKRKLKAVSFSLVVFKSQNSRN